MGFFNSGQNPEQPPVWGNALVDANGSAVNFGLGYNRLETPRSAYPNAVNPQLTGFINCLLGAMPIISTVQWPVNTAMVNGSDMMHPLVVAKTKSGN